MLAGSPLHVVLSPCEPGGAGSVRFGRDSLARPSATAHNKTTYPIDSFDKTDRSTLESFNSRTVRMGCNACSARSDGPLFSTKTERRGSHHAMQAPQRKHEGRADTVRAVAGSIPTSYAARRCVADDSSCCTIALLARIAAGLMWPSSLTSSKRTLTRFETPDSSIVMP
jgi:hypothetical protein